MTRIEGEAGGPEQQVQGHPEDLADLLSLWEDDGHAHAVP